MYPGRRRLVEGRGAAVPYGWPGSDGGGAGAAAAGVSQEGRLAGPGPRRAATGSCHKIRKKNVIRYDRVLLLLPLLHSPGPVPGCVPGQRSRIWAWAWAQRDGGGDGAGAGAVCLRGPGDGRAAKGSMSREDQEPVEGLLATGIPAMGISEPGSATAMMVTTTTIFIPRSQAKRSTFTRARASPTIRAGMIKDRGQGRG